MSAERFDGQTRGATAMITRGFYRHYKGDVYYVHGVGCAQHDGDRRMVVYTSVRTEQWDDDGMRFDYLLRDEAEFEEWVNEFGDRMTHTDNPVVLRAQGYTRRLERLCAADRVVAELGSEGP